MTRPLPVVPRRVPAAVLVPLAAIAGALVLAAGWGVAATFDETAAGSAPVVGTVAPIATPPQPMLALPPTTVTTAPRRSAPTSATTATVPTPRPAAARAPQATTEAAVPTPAVAVTVPPVAVEVAVTTPAPTDNRPTWTQAQTAAMDARCVQLYGQGATATGLPKVGDRYDTPPALRCDRPAVPENPLEGDGTAA